jgi:hypothetical protein
MPVASCNACKVKAKTPNNSNMYVIIIFFFKNVIYLLKIGGCRVDP